MSRGTFVLCTTAVMLAAPAWAGTVAHWEFAPDPTRPGPGSSPTEAAMAMT